MPLNSSFPSSLPSFLPSFLPFSFPFSLPFSYPSSLPSSLFLPYLLPPFFLPFFPPLFPHQISITCKQYNISECKKLLSYAFLICSLVINSTNRWHPIFSDRDNSRNVDAPLLFHLLLERLKFILEVSIHRFFLSNKATVVVVVVHFLSDCSFISWIPFWSFICCWID